MNNVIDSNFIRKNCMTTKGGLNNRSCLKSWWENKNLTSIYDSIFVLTSFLQQNSSLSERLFCIANDITESPVCQVCKTGKSSFKNYAEGYSLYCSRECALKCSERAAKISQNHDYNKSTEKMRKTNLERYGVEYTIMNSDVKEKIGSTKRSRYGSEKYNNLEKMKKTNLERYGVEYTVSSDIVKEKTKEKIRARNPSLYNKDTLIELNKSNSITEISESLGVTYRTVYLSFQRLGVAPTFFRPVYNKMEKQIKEFITDELRFAEEILMNDRTVIKPKEIDIYIPSKKVAIELNGTYWHSFDHIPDRIEKEKHYTKTRMCSDLGITLIQFWDDEWVGKQSICKDIIRRALGATENVIYARNTYTKMISANEAMDFLNLYHIQGGRGGSHRYGLFDKKNDELLSVMVFGKPRFRKDCDFELIRFCSKDNYHVIGGVEKLFSAFIKEGIRIVSYNDIRIFSGQSYGKLGFTKVDMKPTLDYYWVRNNRRYSRNETQKHKLEKFLAGGIYNPAASEDANMLQNGYRKLYGCGQDCWIYG